MASRRRRQSGCDDRMRGHYMKQMILKITENTPVTDSVFMMKLEGQGLEEQKPGQFINIRLDGQFLRRPISVCDSEAGKLTIVYKAVGKGTEQMTRRSSACRNSGKSDAA